jgi:hypothetical protein
MRPSIASLLAVLASIAVPAFAQTTPPGWAPPGADPQTGARPGNDIGTGMSLPTSEHAGNITQQNTSSPIAARLPEPPVGPNASVHDYLIAARNALVMNRTGEAQEALEQAETRLLDRSVPLFQTNAPSKDPMAERIHQVLQTLATGDRLATVRLLEQAIAASDI